MTRLQASCLLLVAVGCLLTLAAGFFLGGVLGYAVGLYGLGFALALVVVYVNSRDVGQM